MMVVLLPSMGQNQLFLFGVQSPCFRIAGGHEHYQCKPLVRATVLLLLVSVSLVAGWFPYCLRGCSPDQLVVTFVDWPDWLYAPGVGPD